MSPAGAPSPDFLVVAEEIGRRIAMAAVWHEDRCNWLGAEPLPRHDGGPAQVTYGTLGPDLYSGTSGVALFLAELFASTREAWARKTAAGAARHALSRASTVPPDSRLGLFSGWIGIALASVRVSILLDEPGLLDGARSLLRQCGASAREHREFDIIGGRSGAITGLIVLRHILGDSSLLELAIELGDELLGLAEEAGGVCSWESPGFANHRNLTGFSHGAAGAGSALLELYAETGGRKYRDAALRAFGYERAWFDAVQGNWPDFRKDPTQRYRKGSPRPCLDFWCHGAPGIALSRVRAHEILDDDIAKSEAMAGLRSTRASLESAIATAAGNFSMCHGLAGNAETLLRGASLLGDEADGALDTVLQVARYGIERHSSSRAPWPCGTHCGETPNFMLGVAGIGHLYLRLFRPSIPSVLILRKNEWDAGSIRVS